MGRPYAPGRPPAVERGVLLRLIGDELSAWCRSCKAWQPRGEFDLTRPGQQRRFCEACASGIEARLDDKSRLIAFQRERHALVLAQTVNSTDPRLRRR